MRFHIPWIRQRGWNARPRSGIPSWRYRKSCRRPLVEGLEARSLLSVVINEFPTPTAASDPTTIVSGPDGNLWFTESAGGKIAEINPTTHVIAEFALPLSSSEPTGIAVGPDGNLWFAESDSSFNNNKIGQINPTAHVITEFSIPTALARPKQVTTGPDGNLWFTEQNGNKTGQINPTTHVITEFPVPTAGSLPFGITAGPDGNLWFTEENGNKIGQINPTTHIITEFAIPTAASLPFEIAAGPDGNLWFTERGAEKIGQINPTTHVFAEFPIATSNGNPAGITAGPDGNVWFTELVGKIGQAVLMAPPPPTAPDLALSGDAPATVNLGNNVTYTLTVTNNGTAAATGVLLSDTLPAGVTFVSATGKVTLTSGVVTFSIGNLVAGAHASFTIVASPTAAGTLHDQANVSMNQADPTPADNSLSSITAVASPTPVPVSGDGPTVTEVQRFGFHRRPTTLVLTFDEPLDPTRAQNLDNYQIVALGCVRRTIHIKAAAYDAATDTVTLSPVLRLNFHHRFRLMVIGTGPSGITDTFGNLLDGRKTGDAGSNFVTIVTARNLVLLPVDPSRRKDAAGEEAVAEMVRSVRG